MAASDILENFSAITAMTKTAASLASSTAGVGRQTTLVDWTTVKAPRAFIAASIKLGTTPTANKAIYLYAIRSNKDTTAIRTDGAGASDAAWTRKVAGYLTGTNGLPSIMPIGAAATGDVFSEEYTLENPGKEWGVGLVHDTGVALNATESNHVISYYADNPQAQ